MDVSAGRLTGKVAIITGAGRGLGRAFALRYAGEGARLLLPDIDLGNVEETAEMIRSGGGEASAMYTDISDEDAVLEMAEEGMRLYGRVDILLNDAAMCHGIEPRSWDAWPVEMWDRFFEVNVRGTWLCCKTIAPIMIKQKSGRIINICSNIIKQVPSPGSLPYACSKAAVYHLTQCLAKALGPSGINVNAIGPGLTATDGVLSLPEHEKMLDGAIDRQCLKRWEVPEDLVGAAVFLASGDADFITGQFLLVDGGAAFI